jgi:hypothetical protein
MKIEEVNNVKYLGTIVTKDNLIEKEIKERIAAGNRAFFAKKKKFQSKLISKKSKIKLYKALIRSVAIYGSECWVLTENIKQKLLVFEKSILRRIFGPTQKADGEWRLKTIEELENVIEFENIVRHINPYPTAYPYGNGMDLHFYQQQESSTTKTVHKVINKGLKTYV